MKTQSILRPKHHNKWGKPKTSHLWTVVASKEVFNNWPSIPQKSIPLPLILILMMVLLALALFIKMNLWDVTLNFTPLVASDQSKLPYLFSNWLPAVHISAISFSHTTKHLKTQNKVQDKIQISVQLPRLV